MYSNMAHVNQGYIVVIIIFQLQLQLATLWQTILLNKLVAFVRKFPEILTFSSTMRVQLYRHSFNQTAMKKKN